MKRVEKRVEAYTTTVYVADDGREFVTESACREHEAYLLRNALEAEHEKYFGLHCLNKWYGDEDALAQYLGLGSCYTLYLIKVDDIVQEIAEYSGLVIDAFAGDTIFLSCDGFEKRSDWYFEGTLEQVIGYLRNEAENLETFVKR